MIVTEGHELISLNEAKALGERLAALECVDPSAGEGLFTFVLKKEPADGKQRYDPHLEVCEFCRVALEIYRYQRDVILLMSRAER